MLHMLGDMAIRRANHAIKGCITMAEKKSKTDVTSRDKSGKTTNHDCVTCGQRIANDREMIVVMDGRRRNKTFHHRACLQKSLA